MTDARMDVERFERQLEDLHKRKLETGCEIERLVAERAELGPSRIAARVDNSLSVKELRHLVSAIEEEVARMQTELEGARQRVTENEKTVAALQVQGEKLLPAVLDALDNLETALVPFVELERELKQRHGYISWKLPGFLAGQVAQARQLQQRLEWAEEHRQQQGKAKEKRRKKRAGRSLP